MGEGRVPGLGRGLKKGFGEGKIWGQVWVWTPAWGKEGRRRAADWHGRDQHPEAALSMVKGRVQILTEL